MEDKVTVGDLNSKEMGSGARKSEGKPDYGLIYSPHLIQVLSHDIKTFNIQKDFLEAMGRFQLYAKKADITEAYHYAIQLVDADFNYSELDDVAKVFTYGTKKYNAFNWMTGMPWSVCIGCIHRHFLKHYAQGELLDDESGESHIAHILCNVQMLLFYVDHYQDGNDLPQSVVNFPDPDGVVTDEMKEAFEDFGEIPIGNPKPIVLDHTEPSYDIENLIKEIKRQQEHPKETYHVTTAELYQQKQDEIAQSKVPFDSIMPSTIENGRYS